MLKSYFRTSAAASRTAAREPRSSLRVRTLTPGYLEVMFFAASSIFEGVREARMSRAAPWEAMLRAACSPILAGEMPVIRAMGVSGSVEGGVGGHTGFAFDLAFEQLGHLGGLGVEVEGLVSDGRHCW